MRRPAAEKLPVSTTARKAVNWSASLLSIVASGAEVSCADADPARAVLPMMRVVVQQDFFIMRAFNLSAGMPYSLDLVDAPRPVPQPGEVLVRLQAAGLNYLDLVVATGRFANPPPSFVPGTDGAGEIVDLGEQVSSWAIGDKVILGYIVDWANGPLRPGVAERLRGVTMPGSLAECAVVPATSLVRMPSALSYAEAATLPIAATTAWNAIVAGNIRPGSTVALLGTGGVSLFALQFAKAAGARVVISSSSDEKLARARALGADVTINYRTTPA